MNRVYGIDEFLYELLKIILILELFQLKLLTRYDCFGNK